MYNELKKFGIYMVYDIASFRYTCYAYPNKRVSNNFI